MLEALTFATDSPQEAYSDQSSAKRRRKDKVELMPGGAKVAVTEENKAEYVRLYAVHRLVGVIVPQLEAFQRGLSVFFKPSFLRRLRKECTPADIKLLLCGAVEIDVDDWEASTTYQGGFAAQSQQVQWFWTTVRAMSKFQRNKVLDFCTGSTQAPATGFANLMGFSGQQRNFQIHLLNVLGTNDNQLPIASTCFNTLKMPAYASEQLLREKLLLAIDYAEGFDEGAVAT